MKSLPEGIDIGRRVKKGDTLVVIDVPDLLAHAISSGQRSNCRSNRNCKFSTCARC